MQNCIITHFSKALDIRKWFNFTQNVFRQTQPLQSRPVRANEYINVHRPNHYQPFPDSCFVSAPSEANKARADAVILFTSSRAKPRTLLVNRSNKISSGRQNVN